MNCKAYASLMIKT